jgi:hypothetical protein
MTILVLLYNLLGISSIMKNKNSKLYNDKTFIAVGMTKIEIKNAILLTNYERIDTINL